MSTPKSQKIVKLKKEPTKSIPKKTIVNEKKPKPIAKVNPKSAKIKVTKPVIKTKQGPVKSSAIPTKKPLTKAKATIKEKITPPKTSEKKPSSKMNANDGSDEKVLKKADNTKFLPSPSEDKATKFLTEYLLVAEEVNYSLSSLEFHNLKETIGLLFGIKNEILASLYTDYKNTLLRIKELTGLDYEQVFLQIHEAFMSDNEFRIGAGDPRRTYSWEEFKEYLSKANNKKSFTILFEYFKYMPI